MAADSPSWLGRSPDRLPLFDTDPATEDHSGHCDKTPGEVVAEDSTLAGAEAPFRPNTNSADPPSLTAVRLTDRPFCSISFEPPPKHEAVRGNGGREYAQAVAGADRSLNLVQ